MKCAGPPLAWGGAAQTLVEGGIDWHTGGTVEGRQAKAQHWRLSSFGVLGREVGAG